MFSLFAPAVIPEESTVVVAITPHEGGSTVRVTHTGAPSEIMENKWKEMLEQLKLSLEVW